VLLALDARSVTAERSLHALLRGGEPIAVVSSAHDPQALAGLVGGPVEPPASAESWFGSVRVAVSGGHYLPAGAAAQRFAEDRGLPHAVVQHGLLTPFAPPLPRDAHLLAFSEDDALFWASGREDVSRRVIGSSLLWEAGSFPIPSDAEFARPVYLGQLHGAELPRRGLARAARDFCRRTGAVYRPHPSEVDRLSRIQHRAWELAGLWIDRSGEPLSQLSAPVVAAFSTGVLEAAARGLPAWVHYLDPPAWLAEFWERYGMRRWSPRAEPTPAPTRGLIDPAKAFAEEIRQLAGGAS
jgi:hypothetical protein